MLHLAKDGIFPITKDKDGKLLKELPASGLARCRNDTGRGKIKRCTFPVYSVSRM